MIKSPFDPNAVSEDAIVALQAITNLSGNEDFFYVAVRQDKDKVSVKTTSTIASEGLVQHLRAIADEMEEMLYAEGDS